MKGKMTIESSASLISMRVHPDCARRRATHDTQVEQERRRASSFRWSQFYGAFTQRAVARVAADRTVMQQRRARSRDMQIHVRDDARRCEASFKCIYLPTSAQ